MTLMVDAVLVITLLEAAALLALRRIALLRTVLAGLALVIALRFALSDLGLAPVALALLAGGLAHLADLRRRW